MKAKSTVDGRQSTASQRFAACRVLLAAIALVCLLIPLMRPAPSSAAPKQALAVLIVSDGTSKAQRVKEEAMIELIHHSLDEQGLPRDVLPILTYHLNKSDERAYCEKSLGIRAKDLVFLGLASHRNQIVQKVLVRETNVKDPAQTVARLFQKTVAILSGGTPSTSPSVSPTPEDLPTSTPSPPSGGNARVMSAALCRGVNAGGEAVDRTTEFSPSDTFYVSSFIKGLKMGTEIEARWYVGGTLIRTNRLTSNKVGDFYAWFSLMPQAAWPPGSYRVTIVIDGRQQATEYFRVNAGE